MISSTVVNSIGWNRLFHYRFSYVKISKIAPFENLESYFDIIYDVN